MKVAVAHDWLDTFGGAEKVLEQILSIYPEADLYLVADVMVDKRRSLFDAHQVYTSFVQSLPFSRSHFRSYLPLMPFAIKTFDLSAYDLVLSSSHCVAKGVKSRPGQVHICYCHTPMRYIWDMEDDYLQERGLTGVKSVLARQLFSKLRQWDKQTDNVDVLIANSQFIAERIHRCYGRHSTVIYPPVDVDRFVCCEEKKDYYVTASRLVSQKKVGLIVEAFARMKDKQLIVIGDGPCLDEIRRMAGDNITVTGYLPDDRLNSYLENARAFIFASLEDFGIVTAEAQASGTPVIAYGKGGSAEIVREDTGLLFDEQSVESIMACVERFELNQNQFSPRACHQNAQRFRPEIFRQSFTELVDRQLSAAATS